MSLEPKPAIISAALLVTSLLAYAPVLAAERATKVSRDAYACVSWAAWHEYGLASLRPRGARMSKSCPLRLTPGTRVVVLEEDAGAGASEIRYRNANWFVDNQALD